MSLLAFMADKFELEPPTPNSEENDDDDAFVIQLNNSSVVAHDMSDSDVHVYNQALRRIVSHANASNNNFAAAAAASDHHGRDGDGGAFSLRQLFQDQRHQHNNNNKNHHHRPLNLRHQQHHLHTMNNHTNNDGNGINDEDESTYEVINYNPMDNTKSADSSNANADESREHHQQNHHHQNHQKDDTKLLISFLLMVIVGTGSKVYQKLGAIPMYNYPNSLNLLQNFIYVPLCFAYILPVGAFGLLHNAIPPHVSSMSKRPFAIMGFYDCITGILLTFAAVYLPGSLLILLPQAAIPISMILSNKIKGERYASYQIWGAFVVVLGILVVLEPLITQRHVADYTCVAFDEEEYCSVCMEELTEGGCLSHRTMAGRNSTSIDDGDDGDASAPGDQNGIHFLWSYLTQSSNSSSSSASLTPGDDHDGMICQWIPTEAAQQSSSSGSTTNTILLWSVMTILACIPMTLSSIYKEMTLTGANSIDPIFLNGWVAIFQFMFSLVLSIPAGMTSRPPVTPQELPSNIWDGFKCYVGISTISSGCHPDDKCFEAPLYVNVFMVFNICFNILIIFVLKFGSANVLVMASTVMVPIGNLVFALPFLPGATPLKDSDIAGLAVILLGLIMYRFGNTLRCRLRRCRNIPPLPWRLGMVRHGSRIRVNEEQFEWDAPILGDVDENVSIEQRGTPSMLEKPLLTPIDREW